MVKGPTTTFVLLFLLLTRFLEAQNLPNQNLEVISTSKALPHWVTLMQDGVSSLGEIIESYELYYEEHSFQKNQYTQQYKRLIKNHSRMSSDPMLSVSIKNQKLKEYLSNRKSAISKTGNEWSSIGPKDLDFGAAVNGNTPGTAHVYSLSFCNGLEQHILAGTATSGLWKSSNNGSSWESISHDLPVNEVKAMTYEPLNPSTIYFAANNTFYKSTNGGIEWSILGGDNLQNIAFKAKKITIHPDHPQTIFLATSIGLFKSLDGGISFENRQVGNIQDLEFHPTESNIIYCVVQTDNKTTFHKSIDHGEEFLPFTEGYPSPTSIEEQKRTSIAVSLDEPDAVWALAVGKVNGGDGLVGVYKSSDTGKSWERKCCGDSDGGIPSVSNKNIMEWDCGGENPGGQYYYDLALGVNPNNKEEILTGGINLWLSRDGGATMECHSDFIYRRNPETYVHADIHDIHYVNGNLWVASDGGIYMSSDNLESFQKKMYGLHGTDFRGFDVGFFNDQIMLGGTYHNGTMLQENNIYENSWVSTRSGDNSTAFINTGDNSIIYDQSGIRELTGQRNKVPHNINLARKPNTSYTIGAASEIVFDPFNFMTIYVGSNGSLYKSDNNGVTFDVVKTFGNGKVTSIEKSTRIPGLIYVVYYPSYSGAKKLMRTTNGGSSWEDVTPPSALFNNTDTWVAFDISIGSHSPYDIWLARVPQSTSNLTLDGAMVYYSSNAGDSWTNITSTDLDGEYPTNIIHQEGSNGGIYLGTRRAVYYRSNVIDSWSLLSNGIPASTFSSKLVLQYSSGKVINATQRGVFSMDFIEPSTPIAIPMVDKTSSDCLRDTFYFMDRSPASGNAICEWTFEGADITTYEGKYPKVTYSEAGEYPIKLKVTEDGNSSIYEAFNFINVTDGCKIDSVVGSSLATGNNSYAQVPAYKRDFTEFTITAWIKRYGVIFNEAGIVMHRDGPVGTGLRLDGDGYLSYLWNEYENEYSEELYVPYNKWTHVAMTVSPTKVTLYVNGVPSVHSRTIETAELLEHFIIGSDAFAITNYMTGNIDEISIYERALTGEEIQLGMNLTHMGPKAGLISYFQANNNEGKLTDRVGNSHAYMMASATRVDSKAPVASGSSQVQVIDQAGTYDFQDVGVSMTFQEGDELPTGPISVVRLNELPELPNPEGTRLSQSYWIFNNHGTTTSNSAPQSMEFTGFGPIDSIYEDYAEIYKMYKVPASWEYGWGSASDSADSIHLDGQTKLIYSTAESLTTMGKVMFAEEGFPALAYAQIELSLEEVDEGSRLSWNEVEESCDYEVLISRDGENFELLKTIRTTSEGNHDGIYDFTHKNDISGRVYYKVSAINSIGFTVESEVVTRYFSEEKEIQFYPNFIQSNENISFEWNEKSPLKVSIFDTEGRMIKNEVIENSSDKLLLDLSSSLYFVQCESEDDIVFGQLVVH